MTAVSAGQEARINEALRRLGDEFRLGMVPEEEYRKRRRLLLESWGERDVTTVPGTMRTRPAPAPAPAAKTATSPAHRRLGTGFAVLVLLAAGAYAALQFGRPARAPDVQSAAAAVVVRSAQLGIVMRSADEFVSQNQWGQAETDAFLGQWRSLSADERVQARAEPAYRTLRHKLAQNIQAESQVADGGNPPAQTERIARLQQFAAELDAGDQ